MLTASPATGQYNRNHYLSQKTQGHQMTNNTQIEKRTLRKTNIEITPIDLGMMECAGGGKGMMSAAFPVISQTEKNAIVKAALDGGINWFDIAELYGNGISEASTISEGHANLWFPWFTGSKKNIPAASNSSFSTWTTPRRISFKTRWGSTIAPNFICWLRMGRY
jgi:hypothetical protein